MKVRIHKCFSAMILWSVVCLNVVHAQDGANERVAILDTAIPFAIGSREGEQTIRGSFGWPTFQEGFVQGVYFRFDPDGYARFSKSPRLDEDVFEVICDAGTTKCIAKKNSLEIGLTAQGQPHLNIIGLTPNDRFFISDRKSELPLPQSILGPIDQRLEVLLSTDGDLIVRRELETLQTFSLVGFSATVTYLRWISQNQSSFIFPRGWPVPSQQGALGNTAEPALTTGLSNTQQIQANRWGTVPVANQQNGQQKYSGLSTQSLNVQPVGTDTYELPASEFAQQAQGRSLTSDVNKFAFPAESGPLNNSYRNSDEMLTKDGQYTSQILQQELAKINRSLMNLGIKLDNLSQQINYEGTVAIRSNQSAGKPNTRLFETTNQNQQPSMIDKTDAEQTREAVIKSTLEDVQNEKSASRTNLNGVEQGEVSVKKTIVERLLEELSSTKKPSDVAPEPTAPKANEFISLSDYINKVMQEEAQQ